MDRTVGEFHRYIRLYPILISFYPTESDIFLQCLLGGSWMKIFEVSGGQKVSEGRITSLSPLQAAIAAPDID